MLGDAAETIGRLPGILTFRPSSGVLKARPSGSWAPWAGPMIYAFEEYELDTELFELRRRGCPQPVEPQVFDLIRYLIEHRDRVVTRDELFDAVWAGRIVSDATLSSRIKAARRAIGDDGGSQHLIRTLHGRGFRFTGAVTGDETPPASPGPPPAPRATSAGAPPGREAALALLHRALAEAAAGAARFVVILGGTGIGKSTLVDAFRRDVEAAGEALPALGRCAEDAGIKEAYLPLLDALSDLLRRDRSGGAAAALLRAAPSWLLQLPWAIEPGEEERVHRRSLGGSAERMLRELADLLELLAAPRPLVLMLEDIHAADRSTLDALGFLARRRMRASLLILATCRETESPAQALALGLSARGLAQIVALEPLNETAVRQYLERRAGGSGPTPALVSLLQARSEGNPLFMESLLGWWEERGLVRIGADGLEATKSVPALLEGVPEAMRLIVLHQLEALEPEDRRLLEAASVLGRRFDDEVLAALIDQPVDEVEARLQALARRGLFVRADNDGFAFRHELHRECVHGGLPPRRRVRLHKAAGAWLEARHRRGDAVPAALLARHFIEAGEAARALEHLMRLGEQATARQGHADALGLLERAMPLIDRLDDEAARERWRARLETLRGNVLVAVEGWRSAEAEAAYGRAVEAAERHGGGLLEAALYRLGTLYELRGDYAHTMATMRRHAGVRAASEQCSVEGEELLACSTFHQGRFAETLIHADRALAAYDAARHAELIAFLGENPAVACHGWAARALWFLGRDDEAEARMAHALTLARDHDHAFAIANAHEQAALLAQHGHDLDRLRHHAGEAARLAEQQGHAYRRRVAEILLAWTDAVAGRPEEALPLVAEGLAACRALGATIDDPFFLALAAEVAMAAGRGDEARARIDEARAGIARAGGFFYAAPLHALEARLERAAGNPAAAAAARERALAIARDQGAWGLLRLLREDAPTAPAAASRQPG